MKLRHRTGLVQSRSSERVLPAWTQQPIVLGSASGKGCKGCRGGAGQELHKPQQVFCKASISEENGSSNGTLPREQYGSSIGTLPHTAEHSPVEADAHIPQVVSASSPEPTDQGGRATSSWNLHPKSTAGLSLAKSATAVPASTRGPSSFMGGALPPSASAVFVVPLKYLGLNSNESVVVVGAHPWMGSWDPLRGVLLSKQTPHANVLTAHVGGLLPGTSLRFKLAKVSAEGRVTWEPGQDRVEELQPAPQYGEAITETALMCLWGSTDSSILLSSVSTVGSFEDLSLPTMEYSSPAPAPRAAGRLLPPPPPPPPPPLPNPSQLMSSVMALSPGLSRCVASGNGTLVAEITQQLATAAEAVVGELRGEQQEQQQPRPVVAATASLLAAAAAGRGQRNTAGSAAKEELWRAAAVICRCSRWVQAVATDSGAGGLSALLAAQPQLAACVASRDALAEALAADAALVAALARTPGLGATMARIPLLADAVAAADGRLASCLTACPPLALAVAADPSLAMAIAGAGAGAGGAWEQGRVTGCLLAECLVRGPSLLGELTPALARVMARSPQVVELVAAEREGLVRALAANNAALAAAVAAQLVLARGLTGGLGAEMTQLLAASPRLCVALGACEQLAAVMAEGANLVEVIGLRPELADFLASSRPLQQILIQHGPQMVRNLSYSQRTALFSTMASNPDLPAALELQDHVALAAAVSTDKPALKQPRLYVPGSIPPPRLVHGPAAEAAAPKPPPVELVLVPPLAPISVIAALAISPQAVAVACHCPGLLWQLLVSEPLAHSLLGHLRPRILPGADNKAEEAAGEEPGVAGDVGAKALELLEGNPALCEVIAQHPSLVEMQAEAVTGSGAVVSPSLLPGLVEQPALVALLTTQPGVAATAAGSPALRQLLVADTGFVALLSASPEVAAALINDPVLTQTLQSDPNLKEAVLNLPQLVLAITGEERLAIALGSAPEPSANSSSSVALSSVFPPLPDPDLSRALASSPDLCSALVASRQLCGAVASVGGLGKALAACPILASALAASPELADAVVGAPDLAQALVDSPKLAEVLGQTRLNPLAQLVTSNFKFATLLGGYQPLATAIADDPRLASLLAQDDGALANAVCDNPGLAQEMDNNIDVLLSNRALAALVASSNDMQDLLLSSDFSAKMNSSKALQQLCSDEQLGPLLLKQRTLMQVLCAQPGLADALAKNYDLADALVKTPVLVQVITSNSEVAAAVVSNGELSGLVTSNRQAASIIASLLLIYTAAQRSQYLAALSSNQALTHALAKCPALVSALVSDQELRTLVVTDVGIASAIVSCPAFGEVLAFDRGLTLALTLHLPGIGAALAAGDGALARLLVEDSGLEKAVARDEDLGAVLGTEGHGTSLALALAACPELSASIQARNSIARLVLSSPAVTEVLSKSPAALVAITKYPRLQKTLAASPELREALCQFPSLARTLTLPDSGGFVQEMVRSPLLIKLLTTYRKLLLAVSVDSLGHQVARSLGSLISAARLVQGSHNWDPSQLSLEGAPSSGTEAMHRLIHSMVEPEETAAESCASVDGEGEGAAAVAQAPPEPEEKKETKAAVDTPNMEAEVEMVLKHCCAQNGIPYPRLLMASATLEGQAQAAARLQAAAAASGGMITLERIKATVATVLGVVAAAAAAWLVATHPLPTRDDLRVELQTDVTLVYSELLQGTNPSSENLIPVLGRGALLVAADAAENVQVSLRELAARTQQGAPGLVNALGGAVRGFGGVVVHDMLGFGGGDDGGGDDDDGGGGGAVLLEAAAVGGVFVAGSAANRAKYGIARNAMGTPLPPLPPPGTSGSTPQDQQPPGEQNK